MLKLSTIQSLITRNRNAINFAASEIKWCKIAIKLAKETKIENDNLDEEFHTNYLSNRYKELNKEKSNLKKLVAIQKELKKAAANYKDPITTLVELSDTLNLYPEEN